MVARGYWLLEREEHRTHSLHGIRNEGPMKATENTYCKAAIVSGEK
jgi:hypothetical protein